MTIKPYKHDKEETSHLEEPVVAYGTAMGAASFKELGVASLKLEAEKAELARAILSIDNEQLLINVRSRLAGLLDIKKETFKMPVDTDNDLLLDNSLHKLAGIWANDPEADKIYDAIRNGRQSGVTRHIVPFDE